MQRRQEATSGRLTEIDEDECWRLLSSAQIGRLAWNSASSPLIVPVNHRVVGRQVVLRVSPYSIQGREVDDARVAFEVDEIDPVRRTGWSVLVQGHAAIDYRHDSGPAPEPWPHGQRPLQVIISPTCVTGRRVG